MSSNLELAANHSHSEVPQGIARFMQPQANTVLPDLQINHATSESHSQEPRCQTANVDVGGSVRPADRDVTTVSDVIDSRALWSLAAQHMSSTWGDRTAEFAFYLYLIELFRSTLLPASLFGFLTTGAAILFSGSIGILVDKVPKVKFVRRCIVAQKLSASVAYALFIVLFSTHLRFRAASGQSAATPVWIIFVGIVISGCVLKLSTVGISVAIERDWATSIAEGNDARLTKINTVLRRIDLLSKLLAPLFVSLLTTVVSYTFSAAFFAGFSVVTMVFEFIWIDIVYQRMRSLSRDDAARAAVLADLRLDSRRPPGRHPALFTLSKEAMLKKCRLFVTAQANDWTEFVRSPIFPSSLAISMLYLTVLSFDGTLISYLKTHNYQDSFVAGMRGVCVVTGLLGTVIMPLMERRLGLIRAGSWAIWSELISLIPVVLSFFLSAPRAGDRGTTWNAVLLFGGMAISRIWLWAFDLCQLKELQTTSRAIPGATR
ncbi:hypothetical protein PLICRDRAFT_48408 [Plicaturopsis crispa FD-325 SS-3]|nr:hypothetical protein PLICRDRAFT_48408 [Plicaturopsis crispa FD-325 SS-3]